MTVITSIDRPFGRLLTNEEFKETTRDKCMYCSEPISVVDEGLVYFEAMDECLCGNCSGHATTRFMATPKTYFEYFNNAKKEKAA